MEHVYLATLEMFEIKVQRKRITVVKLRSKGSFLLFYRIMPYQHGIWNRLDSNNGVWGQRFSTTLSKKLEIRVFLHRGLLLSRREGGPSDSKGLVSNIILHHKVVACLLQPHYEKALASMPSPVGWAKVGFGYDILHLKVYAGHVAYRSWCTGSWC